MFYRDRQQERARLSAYYMGRNKERVKGKSLSANVSNPYSNRFLLLVLPTLKSPPLKKNIHLNCFGSGIGKIFDISIKAQVSIIKGIFTSWI